MKIREKAYAKINLSLSVTGMEGGYHNLDTLVTTIDLFDKISLSPRKDGEINLAFTGVDLSVPKEKNNAYKAIKLFSERFGTGGADVSVHKGIPLGGGLGGSSADVAGCLRAMARAYGVTEDLKPLADELGSDSGYLLDGGFARLTGRGDRVEALGSLPTCSILLLFAKEGVSTPECFRRYDELGPRGKEEIRSDELVRLLLEEDLIGAGRERENALTEAAVSLNPEVGENMEKLAALSPPFYGMSGSGGTTFALFGHDELARWAADKLRKDGLDCLVCRTIDPSGKRRR
ncbi:MAG: 4-(cytidine 5'-diphospho)-2-C-methyl-D-erythritol kinase [Candidatus Borkfalkiaceae bacterium]|nr:4-(cytidine 5'-diphospho)-2-C-methyl-D-erythritol kinase [Christensenellaceae bacterium]